MNQSLYDLPKGWKWEMLGNPKYSLISAGGTPKRNIHNYFQGSIPWAKIGDLTNSGKYISETEDYITEEAILNSNAKIFSQGTVLVSMYGSIGKAAIAKVPISTNQAIVGIQVDQQKINNEYLYYFFLLIQPNLELIGRGATQNNINAGHIKDINIPLPPLPVQERIVEILQKADEIRRKRQEALAIADSILPAIFNDMFGFEEAKYKKYKTVKLKDICTVISGGTPSKKNPEFWTNGIIPWVSPKDMKVPEIYDVPDKITEKALASKAKVEAGTILIVVRGMILQHSVPVCLVQNSLTFNQDIKGLIPRNGIPSEFIFWTLKCSEKRLLKLVDTASHGTKKIDTDRLMNFEIVLADEKAMRYFALAHRHFFDSAEKRLTTTIESENIFNSLLSQAFTGELTAEWEIENREYIIQKQQYYQQLPQLILLSFLQKKRKQTLVTELMKYVFLLQMEGITQQRYYQFIPYHYGPFAKELYTDLETLQQQGLITIDDSDKDKTRITITDKPNLNDNLNQLPDDIQEDITAIINHYSDLDLNTLLNTVYEKYPAYTTKSKLKNRTRKKTTET